MHSFLLSFLLFITSAVFAQPGIVVFQSDFGSKDAAVSEAKGVMYSVDKTLIVSDLTHEIPAYNIWEAAYRLYQAVNYWPEKSVFVSVVDPGVGTARHSVVALTKTGKYFVTPDNGTLTLIDDAIGIKEVRIIDETRHRLKNSNASYTFFGRDVYAYTAAKLAAGIISFEEVGPLSPDPVVKLPYQKAVIKNNTLRGTIVVLDPQYGNVWTNIGKDLVDNFGLEANKRYRVKISHGKTLLYSDMIPINRTFGEVKKGSDLLYLNSLLNLSIATNQASFAKKYQVGSGPDWVVTVEKM